MRGATDCSPHPATLRKHRKSHKHTEEALATRRANSDTKRLPFHYMYWPTFSVVATLFEHSPNGRFLTHSLATHTHTYILHCIGVAPSTSSSLPYSLSHIPILSVSLSLCCQCSSSNAPTFIYLPPTTLN